MALMAQDQLQRSDGPRLSASDLLAIFDPDPARAGGKYIELYQNLVRYFQWNQKSDAEDLAQETFRRGFNRLQGGQQITTQEPAGYFFGIARNLVREEWKARKFDRLEAEDQFPSANSFLRLDTAEQRILLKECIGKLSRGEFEMLLEYFEGDVQALAEKIGVQPGALRLRIHRVRKRLEKLVSLGTRSRDGAKSEH
jgi:RNA polymerase sigma factor (sigma-70 family)